MTLRIDPEFKDYLGPLDAEARQALEESLKAEGCRDALVVWPQAEGDAILLDGHNRFDICERLGIAFRTVNCPVSISDRAGAAAWMVRNQEGRRNLTPDRLVYLRGKTYRAEQEAHGGDRKSDEAKSSGQNVHLIEDGKTAQRVARAFGVNEKTIRRNAKFADAVDAVAAEHGPEAKAEILAGRKKVADFLPKPDPPAEKDDAPPASGATATPESPAPAGVHPDIRGMDDGQCVKWMAANLPATMDSGARPGPVHLADLASDNLADPEALKKYSGTSVFHLCEIERHIAFLPSAVERDAPAGERREMLKQRLARQIDALQAFVASL